MPLSTVLPGASPEFVQSWAYPEQFRDVAIGTAAGTAARAVIFPADVGPSYPVGALAQAFGGDNVGPNYDILGGRVCAVISNTASDFAAGWKLGQWAPGFDPDAFNGGAGYDPHSVVGVFDFHVAMSSAAFTGGGADTSGFWFQPRFSPFAQPNMVDGAPGGSTPTGGFGVGLNDDGGGNSEWQFISYDDVGAILQRTTLAVPDVTVWNTFRFIVVAANSGRQATLTLELNGSTVAAVNAIPFDDVTLIRPNTLQAASVGLIAGVALDRWGGESMRLRIFSQYGRFTPSGVEVERV